MQVAMLGCSTGGNQAGTEAADCAPGPALPAHLSHHHREALLVNPEVQTYFHCRLKR